MAVIVVSRLWTQGATARQRHRRPDFPDVDVQRDIVYKKVNGLGLQLDIYSPKSITHPLPVVLWIHGDGWSRGRKEQRPPINLMAQGYIVVSIEYRLSGEAPFPAQIEDCKAAVRWLRANAATYHFDPDHIGAWGHSAGGHLAALLGTSGGVAELEGAARLAITLAFPAGCRRFVICLLRRIFWTFTKPSRTRRRARPQSQDIDRGVSGREGRADQGEGDCGQPYHLCFKG